MRQLNVNEMEQVNGGWATEFIISYIAGKVLDYGLVADWGSSRYNWDTNLAP